MNYKQAQKQAIKKLQDASVETLKAAIIAMNENLEIDSNAFNLALDVLEQRLSEEEFISFCEGLE